MRGVPYSLTPQSRQWVGRTSIRCLVSALTQPERMRRHANTSACGPSRSMTASSRSRSKGALEIGCHTAPTYEGRPVAY
jgi:hypothetical protein